MRRYSKALLVIGTSVLVAGCLLGDLDGLAGPPVAGEDGSIEVDDAPAGDDALTDGAREASGDAGEPSPCVAMHAFCADFDENSVDQGFTKTLDTGPGALSQGALNLSPPHSLHATSPRKTDTDTWYQAVDKVFDGGWRRIRFQGDIYVLPFDWQVGDVNVAFATILLRSSTVNTGTVWFQSQSGATTTIENPDPTKTQHPPVGLTLPNQWVHMLIDFDPAGHLHVELAGKSYDQDFGGFTAGANPFIELQLGIINFNDPVPAIDAHWDNVFVDFP